MPVLGEQFAITSSPAVRLVVEQNHAQSIFIRNAGSNSVFLGGDNTVTATGGANPGFELIAGATTPMIQFPPEEDVWAVCAAGLTSRVDIIQSFSS